MTEMWLKVAVIAGLSCFSVAAWGAILGVSSLRKRIEALEERLKR